MARKRKGPSDAEPVKQEPEQDLEPDTSADPTASLPAEPPAAPAVAEPSGPPSRDTIRDQIAANRRAQRDAEIAESSALPGAEIIETQALGPAQPAAPVAPDVAPVTPSDPAEALAAGAQTVTLKVYGRERQVDRADVLAVGTILVGKDADEQARLTAGLRELQKSEAGDQRLARAATTEAQLAERERRIAERERALASPRVAPPTPQPAAPAPGVPRQDLKAKAKAITDAMYSGERDVTQDAVTQLLEGTAAQVQPVNVAAEVERALTAREQREQKARADEAERKRLADEDAANKVFDAEFTDIGASVTWTGAMRGKIDELNGDAAWNAKPFVERVREAGRQIRVLMKPAAAAPAQSETERELAAREARKAAMPSQTVTGARRAVPAAPAPRSPSQVVAEMKKARGQLS